MGGDDQTRNLIMAAVLSMLVIFTWSSFFAPEPPPPAPKTAATKEGAPVAGVPGKEAGAPAPAAAMTRAEAMKGPRIPIATDTLHGSIRLSGGRIDDLQLQRYNVRLNDPSRKVILLHPDGTKDRYYIDYGWRRGSADQAALSLPKSDTPWKIEKGKTLTSATPVTLVWDNGAGVIFRRTISVDRQYMFTVVQSVENRTDKAIKLAAFGKVARNEGEASTRLWILHEGAVAQADDTRQYIDYDDLLEISPNPETGARYQHIPVKENGWIGFTDKYWMASLIGGPKKSFDGFYQVRMNGQTPEFQALLRQPVIAIKPGETKSVESMLFAGAKEYYTIRNYEDKKEIKEFINAIDWGWFYFLTKPIFRLLAWLQGLIGNMGVAIITLTLIIKTLLFPLAYKSFVSMSKMKKLQPEMQKLKERVGDDRQKMQQEMMALYRKEKVNPAAGCLPILLQIPIFFSLYKVIFVTLELRHAPFVGWIHDLSAPDPTSILNLFGVLPWGVPEADSFFVIFSIGVYPVLMGITMWLQQKLNPAPTDATQAMIFAWMPWVFMFLLGSFASGLVLYWCANNILTFVQQYAIMRSQGVDVNLLGNIKTSFRRRRAGAGTTDEKPANSPTMPTDADDAADGDGETPDTNVRLDKDKTTDTGKQTPASAHNKGGKGKRRRRGGGRAR